jgi:PIF1-like helicase
MAMASSGRAACLIDEGKTAHSTLAIPLEVDEASTCNFGPRSKISQLINNAHFIIWDELADPSNILWEIMSHLKVKWFYLEVT